MAKSEELLNSQIVVAAFNDESTADQAMQALKAASKEQDFVRRDENNKIHIKETGDIGGGKGAVLGGIAGGIVGLIAGPLAIVTSAIGGALVGGLVAKFWDTGIKNETLQSLGNALQPGTSAIVAVLGNQKVSQLRAMMEQVGGNVMVANMTADIANAVASGQDVAMSVGATNDSISATRVVADESSVEYRGMVARRASSPGPRSSPVPATSSLKSPPLRPKKPAKRPTRPVKPPARLSATPPQLARLSATPPHRPAKRSATPQTPPARPSTKPEQARNRDTGGQLWPSVSRHPTSNVQFPTSNLYYDQTSCHRSRLGWRRCPRTGTHWCAQSARPGQHSDQRPGRDQHGRHRWRTLRRGYAPG